MNSNSADGGLAPHHDAIGATLAALAGRKGGPAQGGPPGGGAQARQGGAAAPGAPLGGGGPAGSGAAYGLPPLDAAALRQGHPLSRCLAVLGLVMQHPAAAPFCAQVGGARPARCLTFSF
jgi:hypothetical protein